MLRISIAILAMLMAAPALAQNLEDAKRQCSGHDGINKIISGCTAMIQHSRDLPESMVLALSNRGIVYASDGQFAKAIADLNEAIRLNPRRHDTFINRGITYDLMQDDDRAIADYSEAIRLMPNSTEALSRRGAAFLRKGDFARARQDSEASLRLDSSNKIASETLTALRSPRQPPTGPQGAAGNSLGTRTLTLDGASSATYAGAQWAPESWSTASPTNSLARRFGSGGESGTQNTTASPAPPPSERELRCVRGDIEAKLEACTDLIRVGGRSGQHMSAYHEHRAIARRAKNQMDLALDDFSAAIKFNPQNVHALNSRGWLYYELGDVRRAVADATEAIRINPRFAQAYNNRGLYRRAIGAHEQAIEDFSEAIRIEPLYSNAWRNRGGTYALRQEYDKALPDLDEAIRSNPRNAQAYLDRYLTKLLLGDDVGAAADYERAHQLDPNVGRTLN